MIKSVIKIERICGGDQKSVTRWPIREGTKRPRIVFSMLPSPCFTVKKVFQGDESPPNGGYFAKAPKDQINK